MHAQFCKHQRPKHASIIPWTSSDRHPDHATAAPGPSPEAMSEPHLGDIALAPRDQTERRPARAPVCKSGVRSWGSGVDRSGLRRGGLGEAVSAKCL